ncbi:Uncharacterised protein [Mycobacterium tuberculosis]|nr:Uncharacterised protein [Mycobacterium tuberculosis]
MVFLIFKIGHIPEIIIQSLVIGPLFSISVLRGYYYTFFLFSGV